MVPNSADLTYPPVETVPNFCDGTGFLTELEGGVGYVGAARGEEERPGCPRSKARSSRRINRAKT